MTDSRNVDRGAHSPGRDNDHGNDHGKNHGKDHDRANPMGAYVATVGAVVLLVSVWLDWVGIGRGDSEQRFSSGYEADSMIPYMGLLGLGFALALLYAAKRADRNQHRGLSLASFAVGLASLLWIVFFFIDPIETLKYAGLQGEARPNVTTSWGLWVGMVGALLWTLGSFLLAKEPEGDIERDRDWNERTAVRPVTTERHVETDRTHAVHDPTHDHTHDHTRGTQADTARDLGGHEVRDRSTDQGPDFGAPPRR